MDDFRNFTKLAQSFPVLDSAGGVICEPNDTPLDSRHLDMTYALQTLTDKVYMGNVVSGVNAADTIAMGVDPVRLPRGDRGDAGHDLADQLQLAAALGRPDARGAVRVLRAPASPSCSRPFILMGAMSPVTIPAALVQQIVEALSGIALSQLIRPGTPGDLRVVPLQHRHAVGLADVRHPRVRASACCAPARSPGTSGCRSAPAAG